MDIYTITFHPPGDSWLGDARHHDRRVALAELAVDAVAGNDERALIALPAGFLRASTLAARDVLAQSLLEISRQSEVGLAFGIDVAPEGEWAPLANPAESFAFVCDAGKPLLWPVTQVRGRRTAERRCAEVGGTQVGVLIAGEAFNLAMRATFLRQPPDVLLVLVHAQATERWQPALKSLEEIAPTIVIEQLSGPPRRRAASALIGERPPPGWTTQTVADTADMTLRLFRPPAVELATSVG